MNDEDLFAGLKAAVRDESEHEGTNENSDDGIFATAAKPLSDDARARIAATLAAKVALRESAQISAPKPTNVVTLRPSRLRYATLFAGAVAVAASVALVVGRGERDMGGAPLPEYALVVTGGDRDVRGAPPPLASRTEIRVREGSRIELVLRPPTKVDGVVEARGFVARDGVFSPWNAPLETADGGSVRVAGAASALFAGRTGAVDVAIAVGRKGAVPSDPTLALTPGRAGVQVVRCRVVLEPGG